MLIWMEIFFVAVIQQEKVESSFFSIIQDPPKEQSVSQIQILKTCCRIIFLPINLICFAPKDIQEGAPEGVQKPK